VAAREGLPPGTSSFGVDRTRGRAVLIWFTNLGEGPPNALRLHVRDVTIWGS
jgi:hypothetical protein